MSTFNSDAPTTRGRPKRRSSAETGSTLCISGGKGGAMGTTVGKPLNYFKIQCFGVGSRTFLDYIEFSTSSGGRKRRFRTVKFKTHHGDEMAELKEIDSLGVHDISEV